MHRGNLRQTFKKQWHDLVHKSFDTLINSLRNSLRNGLWNNLRYKLFKSLRYKLFQQSLEQSYHQFNHQSLEQFYQHSNHQFNHQSLEQSMNKHFISHSQFRLNLYQIFCWIFLMYFLMFDQRNLLWCKCNNLYSRLYMFH